MTAMDSYHRHDDSPLGMMSGGASKQLLAFGDGERGDGVDGHHQQQQQSRVVGSYLLKFAEKNHFGRNYAKFLESTYGNNNNNNGGIAPDGSGQSGTADEEKASSPPGSTTEDGDRPPPPHTSSSSSASESKPLVVYDDDDANDEYSSQLATLTRVFSASSPPWTERHLSAVLRHAGGNLTDSITAVLGHGDGDPDDLVRELEEREARARKEKCGVAAVVSPESEQKSLRDGHIGVVGCVPSEFTVPNGVEDDVSVLSSGLTVVEERAQPTSSKKSKFRTMGKCKLEVTETAVVGSPEGKITPKNASGAALESARGARLSVIKDVDEHAEAEDSSRELSERDKIVAGSSDERSAQAGRDPPTHASSVGRRQSESNEDEQDADKEGDEGEGGGSLGDDTIGNLELKVLQLVGKLGGDGDSLGQGHSQTNSQSHKSSSHRAGEADDAAAPPSDKHTSKQTKQTIKEKKTAAAAPSKPSANKQQDGGSSTLAEQFQAQQYLEQISEQRSQIKNQTRELQLSRDRLARQSIQIEQLEEENGILRSNRKSRERELERENEILRKKLSKLAGKVESLSSTLEQVLSSPPSPPHPTPIEEEDDDDDREDDSSGADDGRRRGHSHHRSSSRAYI